MNDFFLFGLNLLVTHSLGDFTSSAILTGVADVFGTQKEILERRADFF